MNYPYSNGIISTMESAFLDKTKYSKLIKAERSEFVQTLIGMGYGSGVVSASLEELINAELAALKKLLQSISPEPQFTDLFYMTYDAMNLKMLYKQARFDVGSFAVLSSMGAIAPDLLQKAVLENQPDGLSKEHQELILSISKALTGIEDPRRLSAIIDDEVFAFVFKSIRFRFGGAMQAYFKGFVDFANLITLVRSRVLKWDLETFKTMVLHGGLIPLDVFEKAYALEGDPFVKTFQDFYSERISKILRKYNENHNLDKLERTFDAFLLEITAQYQYDAFQIGPILYFYLRKSAEAKNIRLIYADEFTSISDLLNC